MIRMLTVRQPWASSMFEQNVGIASHRRKDIENRTWNTPYRGRLGIHVGKLVDRAGLEFLDRGLTAEERMDLGMVIGTINLVGTHIAGSYACMAQGCHANPWAFWPTAETTRIHHWQVEEPRRLVTPFPAGGRLQLWEPSPSEAHLLEIGEIR